MFDEYTEEVSLQCPDCPSGKENKLSVNIDKGVYNCFRCGFHGRISDLVTKHPVLYSKLEDMVSLAAFAKLRAFSKAAQGPAKLSASVMTELTNVSEVTSEDPHYSYLISRGWTDELIASYVPLKSEAYKYRNRVIVPVVSPANEIVYFTARDITGDARLKYMNPVRDKDFVFASRTPLESINQDDAFICEGIFDAFKIPGACALLGKTLNKTQHNALYQFLKSRKNIYICFDPGTGKEALRLAKELDSWFCNKTIRIMNWAFDKEDVVDLGELSKVYASRHIMRFIKSNSREARITNWFPAQAMPN